MGNFSPQNLPAKEGGVEIGDGFLSTFWFANIGRDFPCQNRGQMVLKKANLLVCITLD